MLVHNCGVSKCGSFREGLLRHNYLDLFVDAERLDTSAMIYRPLRATDYVFDCIEVSNEDDAMITAPRIDFWNTTVH